MIVFYRPFFAFKFSMLGRSRGGLTFQHTSQELYILCKRRINVSELIDLFHRVHDGGVVAFELASNLGQGPAGQQLGEIHGNLAGSGDGTRPTAAHW